MAYKQLDNGHVVNEQGLVAMQYVITPNPKRVIMESTGHDYFFSPQHDVNLAWVHPSDIPMLLTIQEKGCNCNNSAMKQAFILASLANVHIYHTGNQQGV